MLSSRSNALIAVAIVFAVFLWGGNNAGTRFLVAHPTAPWPPIWTGGTRFVCAGLLLLGVLRWSKWFGAPHVVDAELSRRLWLRGGLSLATYIIAFNWALRFTSSSHVALYLGTAPVWALLWEGRPVDTRLALLRYGAAALALTGVFILVWPALRASGINLVGELLGIACSVLWTLYGRQSRGFTQALSGLEVTAHTMWRAGALLLPIGLVEVFARGFHPQPWQFGVQTYCIILGGVVAFGIWNVALRYWPTSKVYLFNNLIPLSTAAWAHFALGEEVTPTFWLAMGLIVSGVVLGQGNWLRQRPSN